MKKILLFILFLLFGFIAFTLSLKNPDDITVNYYFNLQWTWPLVWYIGVLFVAGVITGWFLASVSLIKSKHQLGKLKRQLAKVEKESEASRSVKEAEAS